MAGKAQHLGCRSLGVFVRALDYAVVAGRPTAGDLQTPNRSPHPLEVMSEIKRNDLVWRRRLWVCVFGCLPMLLLRVV